MNELLPLSPESRILGAMQEIAAAAKLGSRYGLEQEFTVRHYRHRQAGITERPCCGIRWMSGGIDEERGGFHTTGETCMIAEIDLVIDMDLPPEDVDASDPSAITDVSGWDHLTTFARLFATLFLAMDSPLRLLVDDVLPGKIDPDEDSKPDQGRLVISLVVLYRVWSEDMMRLLGPGDNA